LSNGGLRLSSDDGNTWRSVQLPTGSQTWKTATVASDQIALVAGLNAKGATVGVTTKAGGSWSLSPLVTSIPDVSSDVALASDGSIGIAMVRFASSSNFAVGEVFSTADWGAWSRHEAPTAGKIAVTDQGTVWLAGGPINDQLWRSRDLGVTWSRITLPSVGNTYAVDVPRAVGNGVLILPVTVANPSGTADEVFLRSADGLNWRVLVRMRTSALIGAGVRLPTAVVGDRLYVVDPSAAGTYVAGPSGVVQEIVSSGLPSGVTSIAFNVRGNGWANVTNVQCATDKRTCSSLQAIFRTLDGGRSWRRLDLGT
jgi:photosystem II stability/assembly factor-like uncharacterized protein